MAGCTYILLTVHCVCFGFIGVVELSVILSRSKPTVQSSNYSFDENSPIIHTSENAVDGRKIQQLDQNSCIHQKEGQTKVWWRVDLQEKVVIEKVEIYYRQESNWAGWKNRFAGYEVYLSNTTERRLEDRCFIDTSQYVYEIESRVNHKECNGTAKYVTIYNHRESPKREPWYSNDALLELCEVEVYGCEPGKYGWGNCDYTCPSNCLGGLCDPISGYCRDCKDGYYGYTCTSPCPNTCGSNVCDRGNGDCSDCKDGYYGYKCPWQCPTSCGSKVCEKSNGNCLDCQDGFYGQKCNYSCPDSCGSNICDKDTGDCTDCQDGFYGQKCNYSCPDSCGSNICDKDTGDCTDCQDGYHGLKCGDRCPESCGRNVCDKDTGNCIDCKDGFYGQKCRDPCPYSCLSNVCEKATGNCIACPDGMYGQRCDKPCPYTCINNTCEQENGKCTDCNVGKYGPTCANCSIECLARKCDFDGHCTDGCVDGKHGDRCELPCLDNCTSCTRDGGQCLVEKQSEDKSSSVATYFGVGGPVVLVLIIAVICKIKRNSATSAGIASTPSVVYGGTYSSNNSDRHSDETEEHVYHDIQDECMVENVYLDLQNTSKPDNVYLELQNTSKPGNVYLDLQNTSKPEQVDPNLQTRSMPDCLNLYCNYGTVDFPVSMLKKLISEKMEDKEKKFTSEFETFPLGSIHPHTIAENNKSKNRFEGIYPYDHSRVILTTVHGGNGSDYINANYIDSVEERMVYVATQGPLRSTIDDFWRMVWTLNSGKIVMLTNLVESQKEKCAKYWPDENDQMSTKSFFITLNRERDYGYHIVRNITLIDRKSNENREIHQFHFTTWPDRGTPNTLELVLFYRRVKRQQTTLPGQMVVHCSAGIGNTGMFIALDALLDHGKKYDRIDIRDFVNKMRKDRMNMIQTKEQYVALHEILVEAFDFQDTLISKSVFSSKYHGLNTTGQPTTQTQLRDEFKLMLDLKPDYKLEQDFLASTLPENKTKNRTMRILAVDKFRALLKSCPSNGNDYINAVITQSYTGRQGYIVTQFPLPDTRTDLWTLVLDYQCETIVILGDEKDAELDAPWIPDYQADIDIGDFNVKQTGTQTKFHCVDVIDVSIKKKTIKTTHSLRVFRLKEWTVERQIPPSKQPILHLLEQVECRRRASGNKPVLITCKDGTTQSGLFCLMANTRDQIKMDQEVDVFQAARQLRIRRPEFLSTFEQYQFCYTILNDYLEINDLYIN